MWLRIGTSVGLLRTALSSIKGGGISEQVSNYFHIKDDSAL
jgi:hypothetical protein